MDRHREVRQRALDLQIIADAVELALEQVDVRLDGLFVDVDQAVADRVGKAEVFGIVFFRFVLSLRPFLIVALFQVQLFPAQAGGIAGVDVHQALAAGVYHAGLLEDGQHLRRLSQDIFADRENCVKQSVKIVRHAFRLLDRLLGDHAGNGQDRALLGAHDRLIRRICAAL